MDQLRRGTTTIAILKILSEEPHYAYRIIRVLEDRGQGLFTFAEGLVYPALHRLERDGLVRGEWRVEGGRRRKYYALTEAGRRRLVEQEQEIRQFTRGLLGLLDDTGGAGRAD